MQLLTRSSGELWCFTCNPLECYERTDVNQHQQPLHHGKPDVYSKQKDKVKYDKNSHSIHITGIKGVVSPHNS